MVPEHAEGASSGLDRLPAPVRRRVVALAASALPQVAPLPPGLRKVAAFAPARRARAGGPAIEAALADDAFRRRVATQLLAAGELPTGEDVVAADPVARAAASWLHRSEGWPEELDAALAGLPPAGDDGPDPEVAGLRERVARLEAAAREDRARARADQRVLKDENADLRRKLGAARAATRAAVADREAAEVAATQVRQEADLAVRQADAEVRRLRTEVDRLARERLAVRRDDRAGRDEATVRARLLLDTVVEAAQGLRRELGLPRVDGVPADAVRLPEAGEAAPGARPAETPETLETLLRLPRARLLVDGYNVSKTAWPTSTLEAQRTRLVTALAPVVARTGAETTVVFDAHEAGSRPVVRAPRGVRVVFSPAGVLADDVLRDFVAAEPTGRPVVTVTSDAALGRDLGADGARVVPAETLVGLLG
ncbi:NYN domain-containing protein [Nocardioides solisilvae]|uniref:NYN domain-containing protein n=1 Tax=Nocardioides solisilvae TaxID=1542435 RepID=UPI000D74E0C3|nr:NYN domain-containing protein [Nocardioides solisilvae]